MAYNPPSQGQRDDFKFVPRADQGPYNLTPSQAATTEYASTIVSSSEKSRNRDEDMDRESQLTSYTYASENDARRFLKRVDNRVRTLRSC